MEVHKLAIGEHGNTRALWEAVFPEDTKQFLDYYYFLKARENEIYVVEEDDQICSMLQLNPYSLQVAQERFTGHYIIAVATDPAYRKRGYMSALLRKSMEDMYDRGELFTYLMPAAESIYTPYDFRFVYDQDVWKYHVNVDYGVAKNVASCQQNHDVGATIQIVEASLGDGALLSEFFQTNFANRYQVYANRNEGYYQTMLFEQQSENGGIRLLKKKEHVVGTFLYSDEGELEIREPLCLPGYEDAMHGAFSDLCQEKNYESAQIAATSWKPKEAMVEKKPIIMVRILHLEKLLQLLKVNKGESIHCSFAVLDPLITKNSRVWRVQGEEELQVSETEDSEGVLTIGALTSLLFGYRRVEEIAREEHVFLTDHLKNELKKLQPLDSIFLNEVV